MMKKFGDACLQGVWHGLNWVAAMLVLAVTCPGYEGLASIVGLLAALFVMGCEVLAIATSAG